MIWGTFEKQYTIAIVGMWDYSIGSSLRALQPASRDEIPMDGIGPSQHFRNGLLGRAWQSAS